MGQAGFGQFAAVAAPSSAPLPDYVDHDMKFEANDQGEQALLHQRMAAAQQHQQRLQQQQYVEQALFAASEAQTQHQNGQQATFESQAALHQRYATLPSIHSSFASGLPSSALSFTPSPELVANALQQAAFERSMNATSTSFDPSSFKSRARESGFDALITGGASPLSMDSSLQHSQHSHSDTHTPGLIPVPTHSANGITSHLLGDVDARLANFALSQSQHQQQEQVPYTLDPSTM